jgi:hypothetical protein
VRAARARSPPAPTASVVEGRSVATRSRTPAPRRRARNSGSLWTSLATTTNAGWTAAAIPVAIATRRRRKSLAASAARRGAHRAPAEAVATFERGTFPGRPRVAIARKAG